jgi:hypothetical protein
MIDQGPPKIIILGHHKFSGGPAHEYNVTSEDALTRHYTYMESIHFNILVSTPEFIEANVIHNSIVAPLIHYIQ